MKTYSTVQAAERIGINRVTLQNWLIDGKVSEPRKVSAGATQIRIWTDRDIERVKRYKAKFYRKGRGRKPRSQK